MTEVTGHTNNIVLSMKIVLTLSYHMSWHAQCQYRVQYYTILSFNYDVNAVYSIYLLLFMTLMSYDNAIGLHKNINCDNVAMSHAICMK